MKLFEHPDFEQAIIRAAEHFHSLGMREAIIEKDYYVTEALRIIQQMAGDRVMLNFVRLNEKVTRPSRPEFKAHRQYLERHSQAETA